MIVNNVKYHIETTGHGEPIVLLHGFTGSTKSWKIITSIISQHFETICIDLLGHGKTDAPMNPMRYSMQNAANDLITIFRKLNISPTNLLGYSMGGRLALFIAAHYPDYVKSLILESSSPGLKTYEEREKRMVHDDSIAKKIEAEGLETFVNFWENITLWQSQKSLPQTVRQNLRDQRLQNNPSGLINSLKGMGTGKQPDLWPMIHQINLPVTLIAGEFDEKFISIAKEMQGKLPFSQLDIIPQAGHTTHLEQPHIFAQVILTALSS